MSGWVKLHRRLLEWEWYKSTNTKVVFIHLLLLANTNVSKYKGYTLSAGQLITSVSEISSATGLTIKQVRTSLNRLKMTNELAIKVTNKFSIITIANWENYQVYGTEEASKTASNRAVNGQAKGKQRASLIEEDKNIKTKEEKRDTVTTSKTIFIPPTLEEVRKYCRQRSSTVDPDYFYEYFDTGSWVDSNGKKVKNWKQKIITWEGRSKDAIKVRANSPKPYGGEFGGDKDGDSL